MYHSESQCRASQKDVIQSYCKYVILYCRMKQIYDLCAHRIYLRTKNPMLDEKCIHLCRGYSLYANFYLSIDPFPDLFLKIHFYMRWMAFFTIRFFKKLDKGSLDGNLRDCAVFDQLAQHLILDIHIQ